MRKEPQLVGWVEAKAETYHKGSHSYVGWISNAHPPICRMRVAYPAYRCKVQTSRAMT
jgi:hypothetical protein